MQISADDTASLELPVALNIRAMTEIKELLTNSLQKNSAITLEIAENSHVDLSFVQLIEAARAYAASHGKTVTLKTPASGAVFDVLRRGGFTDDISSDIAKFWLHGETV